MPCHLRNVTVVGTSNLSTAILHSLSHATQPTTTQTPNNNNNNNNITSPPPPTHSPNPNHAPPSPYTLTLLNTPHQQPPSTPTIQHKTSDYTLPSLTRAFANQHIIISTIAPADIPFQKRLIDAAIAAGVRHFIPCEFSYDTQSAEVGDAYPPAAARGQVLGYLREKERVGMGMGWTALATGCGLEKGLEEGLLGFDLLWRSGTRYGSGEERWAGSTLEGVGRAVVEVVRLLEEEEEEEGGVGRGRYLYRAEFVTCQNEVLGALERGSGGEWDVVGSEVEECVWEGKRRMEKGFFEGAMVLLERNVLFGGVGGQDVWGRCGGDGERLERVVRRVVERLERDGKKDCGCG